MPYADALQEMLRTDILLILQATNCNAQVPAKLYEYLRAGRPVLCLSDAVGDTWTTLHAAGVQQMAPLDSVDAIVPMLARCAEGDTRPLMPAAAAVAASSRSARTVQLAALLDQCTPANRAPR